LSAPKSSALASRVSLIIDVQTSSSFIRISLHASIGAIRAVLRARLSRDVPDNDFTADVGRCESAVMHRATERVSRGLSGKRRDKSVVGRRTITGAAVGSHASSDITRINRAKTRET